MYIYNSENEVCNFPNFLEVSIALGLYMNDRIFVSQVKKLKNRNNSLCGLGVVYEKRKSIASGLATLVRISELSAPGMEVTLSHTQIAAINFWLGSHTEPIIPIVPL